MLRCSFLLETLADFAVGLFDVLTAAVAAVVITTRVVVFVIAVAIALVLLGAARTLLVIRILALALWYVG